jgi:hypothetical protein
MEDDKKKYTFTDKRGRAESPGPDGKPEVRGEADEETAFPDEGASHVDFNTLIMSLASAAMISMGIIPDPMTGQKTGKNMGLARQNIDIMILLRNKTRGNLTREEESLLDNILYELRMSFIEAQKG